MGVRAADAYRRIQSREHLGFAGEMRAVQATLFIVVTAFLALQLESECERSTAARGSAFARRATAGDSGPSALTVGWSVSARPYADPCSNGALAVGLPESSNSGDRHRLPQATDARNQRSLTGVSRHVY